MLRLGVNEGELTGQPTNPGLPRENGQFLKLVYVWLFQQYDEHCSKRCHCNATVAEPYPLLEGPEGDLHHAKSYRRTDEQHTVQTAGNYCRRHVLALDAAKETAENDQEVGLTDSLL